MFAAALVFLGMLLDSVDGWVARLTRTSSPLGGHLDSLADVVTFGVAPAYMMLQLIRRHVGGDQGIPIIGPEADDALGKAVWAVAVVYLCCAALRLARFNVSPGRYRGRFEGLSSPPAAGMVLATVWFVVFLRESGISLGLPASTPPPAKSVNSAAIPWPCCRSAATTWATIGSTG